MMGSSEAATMTTPVAGMLASQHADCFRQSRFVPQIEDHDVRLYRAGLRKRAELVYLERARRIGQAWSTSSS